MSIKEEKTLVIVMPEGQYGVDAILAALANTPSPFATNALLCGGLDITGSGDALERTNYSPSLSPDEVGVGRVGSTLTFTTELRGSGKMFVPPRIGNLFKGAGTSETIVNAGPGAQITNAIGGDENTSAGMATIVAGLLKTTAPVSIFDYYRVTISAGGAAGAAKYIVTSSGFPQGDPTVMREAEHSVNTQTIGGTVTLGGTLAAPTFTFAGSWVMLDYVELFVGGVRFYQQVQNGDSPAAIAAALAAKIAADARFVGTAAAGAVITVALSAAAGEQALAANQAIPLGSSGAVVTLPAFAGALNAGESFEVNLLRPGVHYDPISDNVTSLSFWVLLDGNLHRFLGARGTATVDGQAAQYGTISWTFTGIYYDPVEYPIPQGVRFEKSKPYKVELAELALTNLPSNIAKAQSFQMDFGNEVTVNDNINAKEAYDEIEITDRTATMGCNPEATKPGVYSPWARMRKGDRVRMHVSVGALGGPGNVVRLMSNNGNYTGAPYAARNKRRVYNIGIRLARRTGDGNDEFKVYFGS